MSSLAAHAKAHYGFSVVYVALGLLLALACFSAGLLGPWKVQPKPRIVETVRAPKTGAALVAAWGKPDQTVDGGQVNAALAGTTCALYQARSTLICYAP